MDEIVCENCNHPAELHAIKHMGHAIEIKYEPHCWLFLSLDERHKGWQ